MNSLPQIIKMNRTTDKELAELAKHNTTGKSSERDFMTAEEINARCQQLGMSA